MFWKNIKLKPAIYSLLFIAISLFTGGCNMHLAETRSEGIGYREARFAEISAMREFRKCRDEALALDSQARKTGITARYLASARILDTCETELGPRPKTVAAEERIRSYALSVQNYFKGGDISKARSNLEKLEKNFPGRDLYLADGSSFIETMKVVLSLTDKTSTHPLSLSNVSDELKAELRRVQYWTRN